MSKASRRRILVVAANTAAILYALVAVFVFVVEAAAGPVTPALAAVRGIGWPIYIATDGRWPPTTRGIPFEGDE